MIRSPVSAVVSLCLFFLAVAFSTGEENSPPPGRPPPIPDELLRMRPPPPPPAAPDDRQLREQLELFDQFLQLPPEKLRRMRQTIEAIERMSEEDRELFRVRIRQFTEMSPQMREEIRREGRGLPAAYQRVFSQYWLSLYPEEREQRRSRMEGMAPEERQEFLVAELDRFQARMDEIFAEMRRRMEEQRESSD